MGTIFAFICTIFILTIILIAICIILTKNVKEFHIKIGKRFEISSTFFKHHQ